MLRLSNSCILTPIKIGKAWFGIYLYIPSCCLTSEMSLAPVTKEIWASAAPTDLATLGRTETRLHTAAGTALQEEASVCWL